MLCVHLYVELLCVFAAGGRLAAGGGAAAGDHRQGPAVRDPRAGEDLVVETQVRWVCMMVKHLFAWFVPL